VSGVHIEPFAIGDRVLLYGVAGVVEHVARSLATEQPIITVAFDPRIKLRVSASEVRPA